MREKNIIKSNQQRFPFDPEAITHLKIVNGYGHTLSSVKVRLDDTKDVTFTYFDSDLTFEFRKARSSDSHKYQDGKYRVWHQKGDKWRVVQSIDFNNGLTGDDLLMPNTTHDFNKDNSIIYHPGNLGAGDDSTIMNVSNKNYLPLAYDDDGISGNSASRLTSTIEDNTFLITLQPGFQWQFHFRNFTHTPVEVAVHHSGCAMTPWHDGRAMCWHNKTLGHCPAGLADGSAVYVPADWVINFGLWWSLIVDGLTLVYDVGVAIVKRPPSRDDIASIIGDILHVGSDIVALQLSTMSQEELDELLEKAQESLPSACKSIGVTEEYISKLAAQMSLKNWAFIAGDTYKKFIQSDDSTVTTDGWSVCAGPEGKHNVANHAFLEKGHLVFAVTNDEETHKLWTVR